MSKSINCVELLGYLGKDPESIILPSGLNVVRFPLATHERYQDQQTGTLQSHTDWHRIVIRGREGVVALEQLKKGSLIYLRGVLRTRQYVDTQERPHFITEVINRHFIVLDASSKTQEVLDEAWIENDDESVME